MRQWISAPHGRECLRWPIREHTDNRVTCKQMTEFFKPAFYSHTLSFMTTIKWNRAPGAPVHPSACMPRTLTLSTKYVEHSADKYFCKIVQTNETWTFCLRNPLLRLSTTVRNRCGMFCSVQIILNAKMCPLNYFRNPTCRIFDLVQDVSAVSMHAVRWIGSPPALSYLFGAVGVNTRETKYWFGIFCHCFRGSGGCRCHLQLVTTDIHVYVLHYLVVKHSHVENLKCTLWKTTPLKKILRKMKSTEFSNLELFLCCKTQRVCRQSPAAETVYSSNM